MDRSHDNSVDPGGRIRKKFNIRVKGYEVIFAMKFVFSVGNTTPFLLYSRILSSSSFFD